MIIVGYQGAAMIGACLRSISRHCGQGVEVVLVDNASQDGTVAAAEEAWPGLRVHQMGRNAGYGCAANAGVALAQGEYCLLLNQDLELETGVEAALGRLESDPLLALVGCRLQFPDGRQQFGLGRAHTPWRLIASWLIPLGTPVLGPLVARIETRPEVYGRAQADLNWVSGAFLAFRRRDWVEIGGMDEDFFLYVEDVELAHRLRAQGRRIGYEPGVRVCHREAAGKDWPGQRALAWTFEGYLRYLNKHGGSTQSLVTRAGLLGACLWRALVHSALCLASLGRQRAIQRGLHREKAGAFLHVARSLLAPLKRHRH